MADLGYHRKIRTVTGAILAGRLVTEKHEVLVETVTGGVWAQPGDLILILPNKHKLVLRASDYPCLVTILPTPLESLMEDAMYAEEITTLDDLEDFARARAREQE